MRHSKAHVYLHIVWTTWQRQPYITPDIERAVYHSIENEAKRLEATLLAIGGMPDHVHLVVKIPTRLSIARLMNQIKGVSSHCVHEQLPGHEAFRWQEGYGVFSMGLNQVGRAIAYVQNQKRHHANKTLWPQWEEAEEECIPPMDQ
ncbi:MAG TPA: IS200/IS605 family transposase [Chthonomonadaceae bacterium]|nr:IS200/IS605 family transposase [Chthonomonadaceae bacterium]